MLADIFKDYPITEGEDPWVDWVDVLAYSNQTLVGTEGVDYLYGKYGNDTVSGDGGDDVLSGDSGSDHLDGGGGGDTLGGGDDGDFLNGGEGHDDLWGDAGDDTLHGGDGGDELYGGDGEDALFGGNGDDRLFGSAGPDQLTGGAGNDIFVDPVEMGGIGSGNRDVIFDFAEGDKIDLAAQDDVTGMHWLGTGEFNGAGSLRYYWTVADTVVECDTDGDAVADFQIELAGHVGLDAGDFLL